MYRPQRDAADEPLIALPDLMVRARHRLDDITRLHVTVRADRRHDGLRGQFEFDRDGVVLWIVGHLVSVREAVRVPGRLEHAAHKPRDGLGVTRGERRLAAGDVGVPGRRPGALLGDLPVVLGLGHGQRLLPLRLVLAVFGHRHLEPVPRLRHLPLVAGSAQSAQETAQSAGRGRREIVPVRIGKGLAQRAGIEGRRPRGNHEPVKAHRRERQHAGQHLVQALDLLLHRGGLLVRGPLLGFQMLLLADLLLLLFPPRAFSRQPFIFPVLRGQAALPVGEIPAAGHVCCAPIIVPAVPFSHPHPRLGGWPKIG